MIACGLLIGGPVQADCLLNVGLPAELLAQGLHPVVVATPVSNELVERGVRAGDWVKEIAPIVGGGGGGKPDMAQAGGTALVRLNRAEDKLEVVVEEVEKELEES